MSDRALFVFFNFRSPYCYLASRRMWAVLERPGIALRWRPLGGWDGRSPPERARVKIPLVRQDVARWGRRLGMPVNPPPISTDPTRAGAGSLLAEERGVLKEYVIAVLEAEWAEGRDIGDPAVLREAGARAGLDAGELAAAMDDPERHGRLADHWAEAQRMGVIGVPSFVVGDQTFWGNDRLDFLSDHLDELQAAPPVPARPTGA